MDTQQNSAQGHYASINGIQLYYEIHGEGAPLLLLHGLLQSSAQWQSYMGDLAKHYQLIIPDMRGHGRSLDAENGFTMGPAA